MKKKSKGLGDTVAKITKATGIDKAVKFVFGEDCGCDERKEKWNELWKYKVPNCLSENDYLYLQDWFKESRYSVTNEQQKRLIEIYNAVFHWEKKEISTCVPCVASLLTELYKIYSTYESTT